MANQDVHAVLMGDLVRSERTANPTELHAHFNNAINRQNSLRKADLTSPLTITLGDEFQGLASSFTAAVQIAREIRLELLASAIDCRFAIGLARINTPVNRDRAWNMMGPGLAATRERLEEKRASSYYRFAFPDEPVMETLLEAAGATLTAIERNWSDLQRQDIVELLKGADVAAIAQRRKVSPKTVYKSRQSGDFDLYELQWNAIYRALAALDTRFDLGSASP